MYLPSHFEEADPAVLQALLQAHPLATWVTQHDGELLVNHVPFMFDRERGPHGTLVGHMARANPLWQRLGRSVLVFQGAQAYISPSWYPSKQQHGKAVPTWNYAVVHAHGQPRAVQDRAALLAIVSRLTDTHEAPLPAPWAVADAPPDYIEQMLGAIVGIEMPIERLVGKWKVSQNRSAADRQGVVEGLQQQGLEDSDAMARLVQTHAPR